MKEIKLRVWDADNKVFCHLDNFIFSRENLSKMLDKYERLYGQLHSTPDDCYIKEKRGENKIKFYPTSARDVTIQQWTGLKDKNKKDVYEGDIVKVKRCGVRNDKLVELGEETGEVLYIAPEYVTSFEHLRYDDIEQLMDVPHRLEVIGNIFENPELLS